MKTLNIPFDDDEFRLLENAKDKANCKSWKKFIMRKCTKIKVAKDD